MSGHATKIRRSKQPRYRRYVCQDYGLGAQGRECMIVVPADPIERMAMDMVANLIAALERPALMASLRRAWTERQQLEGTNEVSVKIAQLEARRERLHDLIAKAVTRFVAEEIDRAAYEIASTRLQSEAEDIERELGRLRSLDTRPTLPDLDEVLSTLSEAGGWASALPTAESSSRRSVLACLVERIVPVRVGHGKYRLEITWTPAGQALGELVARQAA